MIKLYKQSGSSLIEVLVAIVIMSIGLLGLTALQTTAMKNNHSALLRTQVTILSYELVDLMRANKITSSNVTTHLELISTDSFEPARHDLAEFVVSAAIQREFGSLHGSGCRNECKRRCAQRIFE